MQPHKKLVVIKMSLYCGNNRLNPDVVSGRKRIGTRYQCFKKGIGVGMNLPFDPLYAMPYAPIDRSRIYCGKERRIPRGYTRMGSPATCLRKGVGVGKKINADKRKKKPNKLKRKNRSKGKSRKRK